MQLQKGENIMTTLKKTTYTIDGEELQKRIEAFKVLKDQRRAAQAQAQ